MSLNNSNIDIATLVQSDYIQEKKPIEKSSKSVKTIVCNGCGKDSGFEHKSISVYEMNKATGYIMLLVGDGSISHLCPTCYAKALDLAN